VYLRVASSITPAQRLSRTRFEREAADARSRAEDYTEELSRTAQLELAARFDAMVRAVPADMDKIGALRGQVPEAQRLTLELSTSVNDLRLHMLVAPDGGPKGEELEKFRMSVENIAYKLGAFHSALGAFRGTRTGQAEPPPSPTARRADPARDDAPVFSPPTRPADLRLVSAKRPAPYPGSNPNPNKPPAAYPGSRRGR
jgi:hypothetical protein